MKAGLKPRHYEHDHRAAPRHVVAALQGRLGSHWPPSIAVAVDYRKKRYPIPWTVRM